MERVAKRILKPRGTVGNELRAVLLGGRWIPEHLGNLFYICWAAAFLIALVSALSIFFAFA
jgi:hypothetical protein